MRILQLLGCVRGKHLRSRKFARNDGTYIRSHCVGCGKPMIRIAGGWRVEIQSKPVVAEESTHDA